MDSTEKDERTVYVRNLHEKVTKEILEELFVQMGTLVSVSIKESKGGPFGAKPDEKNKNRFAFVEFEDVESVLFAVEMLDDVALYGQNIVVAPRDRTQQAEQYRSLRDKFMFTRIRHIPNRSQESSAARRTDRADQLFQPPLPLPMPPFPPPPGPPIRNSVELAAMLLKQNAMNLQNFAVMQNAVNANGNGRHFPADMNATDQRCFDRLAHPLPRHPICSSHDRGGAPSATRNAPAYGHHKDNHQLFQPQQQKRNSFASNGTQRQPHREHSRRSQPYDRFRDHHNNSKSYSNKPYVRR